MKPLKYFQWGGRILSFVPPAVSLSMLAGTLLLGLAADEARAATNIVTSLADSGGGSLRSNIVNSAPGDAITFASIGTIILTSGELVIDKDLTIVGPGSANLVISGNHASRILKINSSVSVSVSGLTIRDGRSVDGTHGIVNGDGSATDGGPGDPGGGIYTAGALKLVDCVVTANHSGSGGNGVGSYPYLVGPTAGGAGGPGGAIYNTGTLTLSNCVVSGNSTGNGGVSGSYTYSPVSGAGGFGGGIYNAGTLWLDNSTVSNNMTGSAGDTPRESPGPIGGAGGGIWNGGRFAASRSTFSGNSTGSGGGGGSGDNWSSDGGDGGFGGGICSTNSLALTNCTVSGNSCGGGGQGGFRTYGYPISRGGNGGFGGGIYTSSDLILIDCTIAGNRGGTGGAGQNVYTYHTSAGPGGSGGGIYGTYSGLQSLVLTACTVVSNSVGLGGPGAVGFPSGDAGLGGGIFLENSTTSASFLNTIVALNFGNRPDVSGAFNSLGHNLIGATNGGSGFIAPGDIVGSTNSPVNSRVQPLADNGGPTLTMALMFDSPAINTGTAVGVPPTDQRGVARPQGAGVDIGAYEFQFTIPAITGARFQTRSNFWLQMCSLPNQNYTLQASSNLLNWFDLSTCVADTNGVYEYLDCNQGNYKVRFYRLKSSNP
jgi:hypothetical protein